MKIYKVSLRKRDLSHIPEKEQILFFQIGNMLNEINMLHKITYFCNKTGLTEIENKGQIAQSFFFHSILVGKLWECWEAFRKPFFNGVMSKEYEQSLSAEANENLEKLKRDFGKKQWIGKVRNKFSFHYDREKLQEQIKGMPEDELLEIYLSDTSGNSLYYFSSIIHLKSILESIDKFDDHEAIRRYLSETLAVADRLVEFFEHFLVALTKKYLDLKFEEDEILDPPRISDLHVPFFVSR